MEESDVNEYDDLKIDMNRQMELYCRDELRAARAAVLRDSEAFAEILFAIERTGAALTGNSMSFGGYRSAITQLVVRSALASPDIENQSFGQLYSLVQHGRNEALHQGAFARHLTDHTTQLALILEDALMDGSDRIADYMVQTPVVAQLWQPLSVIRHQMLANSFSFLPIFTEENEWKVVSDLAIARVLRESGNKVDRALRLSTSIGQARKDFSLHLDVPQRVTRETSIAEVLREQTSSLPVLIVDKAGNLLGIATPFDLL